MSLPLNQVILGDCAEVMAEWPTNSVDCVVTDPPYRIGFMGKNWDRALPPRRAFRQILRVLKPGALAFVMSSPRQDVLWRTLAMLDSIGFELRQSFISWIMKTGFPKAYDVSKGIDKKLGTFKEGELLPTSRFLNPKREGKIFTSLLEKRASNPQSDEAKRWEGWKSISGLKPALECVLMVNKPLSEPTIVDNVLRWGTGAINVDACRIPLEPYSYPRGCGGTHGDGNIYGTAKDSMRDKPYYSHERGRFPANILVQDGALDTGEITKSGVLEPHHHISEERAVYGEYTGRESISSYGDEGGPFRYFDLDAWAEHHGFLDVQKPSKAERDRGLVSQPLQVPKSKFNLSDGSKDMRFDGVIPRKRRNVHPTVKPVKLMAYLIELGCPKGGVVVDPFAGSGTTCIAAKKLRRKYIGIEINPEYAEMARARIDPKGPLDRFIGF